MSNKKIISLAMTAFIGLFTIQCGGGGGGGSSSPGGGNTAPSGLTYSSGSTPTYTIGITITENVPAVTGAVASWAISAGSLPTGLNMGSDGHIIGMPTVLQSATNVTIRATNSAGYTECILQITVNDAAPLGLTYSSNPATYTINLPITENVSTVTGTATSWNISAGSLPTGLNLGSDGKITGTPTALQSATNVTIRATNSGGYTEATLSITVNDVAPTGLTYASMSPTYTKDAVITTNVPTVTGTVTSWTVSSGSIPAGLNLNSDGKITGTPTALQIATDVIIAATNSGGYTECTLSITVNDAAPSGLTYASMFPTYTLGTPITENVPTVTGTVTSWTISSGSLPAGLVLGTNSHIYGTPTALQTATNVTIKAANSGGFTEAVLSITVNDQAPTGLTYASMSPIYTKDLVITANVPTVAGTVTSWSISSGSMPAGLNLGSDGRITGTPTAVQSATNVTIRATNSGGDTYCTLSITVNYAAPTGLTYASMSPTYTLGAVITANVPTVTGTVTSWSVSSGTLPVGLNLNSDGTITGTPTALQIATDVIIAASNSGGDTYCTLSITVNDAAPTGLTYANMSPTYTKDAVITANVPTVTGTVTSWSISSGSMPSGLNLGSDGKITGTPTALQTATNVTIRATNSGGYTEATLSITVNDAAPTGLTYASMSPTYTKDAVITANIPTVTGTITSWSVSSGSMPAGLNLGSDGKITGTPTALQTATNVTIRATNSGGYTEATLSITVNDVAPSGLTYASMSPTYTKDAVITANVPAVTGTITSWTISAGVLPDGLNLNSDGTITGTPTALQTATNVTIRATNSGGYTEAKLSITVNDVAPSGLTYASMSPTYTKDAVITANVPTVTGTVTSWSISAGSMPAGLNLGSDGKITGTPTALQIAANVTIRATNSGGYTECTISITVNDLAPSGLTYASMSPTYTKDAVITANVPTVTGTIISWSIYSGSMPAGLNLGSDGHITGTPTALQSATNVTIRATNSGGYTDCVVSITVNDVAPSGLTYANMSPTYTVNLVIIANVPTVTGTVVTWSVSSGSLPTGLNLGSDGRITGTPTALQSATNVTIRATNSGGYTECVVSITVNDVAPLGLTYSDMTPKYALNFVITANVPSVTGTVVTWSVSSGSLPTGLNLGSDGRITGTPTVVQGATDVTIRAANSGGYTECTVSITVRIPGSIWTSQTLPSNTTWTSITYGNGRFVAVAGDTAASTIAAYSTDGINWTATGALPSARWSSVTYGNGYFVAVSGNSTTSQTTAYLADGSTTWTTGGNLPTAQRWTSVAYGNISGTDYFVAISGYSANSNRAAYSTNHGTSWTASTLPSSRSWSSVTFGNGRFIAIAGGLGTAGTTAAYSTNGKSWTATGALTSSQRWSSVTYGNGRFVAVAGASAASIVTNYSTNGTSWVAGGAIASNRWRSVAYGNNYFVAVSGYTGNPSTATSYSTDAVTWTAGGALPASAIWTSVCYGTINTGFAAVASGGTNGATTP